MTYQGILSGFNKSISNTTRMPGKARTKVIEISQIIPFSDDFKDAMTDAFFFLF